MAVKFGCLGDSGIDAFRGTDNRGGAFGAFTFNPIELLARLRGFDLGSWGNYAEPRRTDYANNWARSSAISTDLAAQGQVSGLVNQVSAGSVDYIYIRVGANDFAWYDTLFGNIYSGALSGTSLTAELTTRANALLSAVDSLLSAGASGVIARTFPYWGEAQAISSGYNSTTGLNRVKNAVSAINTILKNGMANRDQNKVNLLDIMSGVWVETPFLETYHGHTGTWYGKEFLYLDSFGDDPHYWMLSDQVHNGTIVNSFEANWGIVEPLRGFGVDIKPISPSEAWVEAGVLSAGIFGSVRRI